MPTPPFPPPSETRSLSPARVTTPPPEDPPLAGTSGAEAEADIPGGHSAPEDEPLQDTGVDTSAPERDDDPGISNTGAGTETTKTSAEPEQQQQQQQQEQQQQQQPPQPETRPQPSTAPTQPAPKPTSPPAPKRPRQMAKIPAAAKATSALEPNPDRQVALHMGAAASGIQSFFAAGGGLITPRTASGNSLGSLKQYCMDWNSADASEVSSASSPQSPHPAGPSALAQKMHILKLAVADADKTAAVSCTLHFSARCYILPSPRDSSGVTST